MRKMDRHTHNDSVYTGRYSWTLAYSASVHKLHGQETIAALVQLSDQENKHCWQNIYIQVP